MSNAVPIGRLQWLTAFRGLTALYIVMSHAFRTVAFTPTNAFETFVCHFVHGNRGVPTFIALSGFSLALSVRRYDWRLRTGFVEFAVKRWKRLAPEFYVAIALALVLVTTVLGTKTGTHWDYSLPAGPLDAVRHALFIGDLGKGRPRLNHVFYSMGVEFKLSLLFPLLILALRRGGPYATLTTGAGLAGVALAVPILKASGYATFIGMFACGVVACYALDRPVGNRPLLLFFAVVLGLAGETFPDNLGKRGVEGVWGLSMCLVFYLLSTTPSVAKWLEHRWLVAAGGLSYSLYLVHAAARTAYLPNGRGLATEGHDGGLAFVYLAVVAPQRSRRIGVPGFLQMAIRPHWVPTSGRRAGTPLGGNVPYPRTRAPG